CYQYMSGYSF
nr:immunoglobulin light chain junction region [Macaca mulatta]MOW08226.1 immunoglobulin light chain junction region [Macaca mulatta]MOW08256.1 immunoglobulin light chain junction region [Macaca mulatta]MOW08281.1 immunoglobulin light chain junction region [Macaca mulatta]MOW08491.1 immunoglobulin light chain junction region [Macaca mulatta]